MLATVGVIAALISTLNWRGGGEGFPKLDAEDRALVSRGKAIYASHCAACHGAHLEGQPDWRNRRPNGRLPAPPQDATGHAWHHPDQVLFSITKDGLVPGVSAPAGYESDMPAFKSVLSDAEIASVLAYIKSTWPAELQAAQQEVTREYQNR
ncbi:c-type cytochrome [Cupriavidus sp. IDO]|uniref:c-type cytochrome n=1 Tax=Cupriavidus sp. IDO TaxID=1539142 RepID=UPI00057936E7